MFDREHNGSVFLFSHTVACLAVHHLLRKEGDRPFYLAKTAPTPRSEVPVCSSVGRSGLKAVKVFSDKACFRALY